MNSKSVVKGFHPVQSIKASVRNWLGVPLGLMDLSLWPSKDQSTGQVISSGTALKLSAVVACVRLISESIATLPLVLYDRNYAAKTPAVKHPLYQVLLTMPNKNSTASVMWESFVAAMLLNGFGRCQRLAYRGETVGLDFLDPIRFHRTLNMDGTFTNRYIDVNNKMRIIPPELLFEVPGFSLDNGRFGVSAIMYGSSVIGAAQASDQAAATTFKNGMMPTTYFYMDRVLKAEQRTKFREETKKEIMGSMNAGNSPLLEAGMKVGTVGINPTDAQLLESRGWSVEEICRLFRVPPWMIGHMPQGQMRQSAGLEQELLMFLTFTLRPWLARVEQGILKDLLSPAERLRYYVAYDIKEFLKTDSAARSAFYSVMVNNGIMTRDECRQSEGLPLLGGNADVLTVQTALTTLNDIGKGGSQTEKALATLAQYLNGGLGNEHS